MDELILRVLLGGAGIALVCGPLGCLVVWQRMSYFGAALSHAALLGIALGFLLHIDLKIAILGVSLIVSLCLLSLSRLQQYSVDTLLGVLAHVSLALGIITLSLMPNIRIDMMSYLFGDILAINWQDVLWIYTGGIIAFVLLMRIWNSILALTLHRELALVDGINEPRTRLVFLIIMSIVVAISMQLVGVLLVVSLLIIPAATARNFADSPEQMAVFASLFGLFSMLSGLVVSFQIDTPTGPSIVLAAGLFFALSLFVPARST